MNQATSYKGDPDYGRPWALPTQAQPAAPQAVPSPPATPSDSPDYSLPSWLAPDGGAGGYQPAGAPAYDPVDVYYNDHSKYRADKNRTAVLRAEWEDYKRRFRPVENRLISDIGNRDVYAREVGRARDSVDTAFANTRNEYQRNQASYGRTPSAAEADQQQRAFGLAHAKASAEAANRTRSAVKNRNMQIMGGGLSPTELRQQGGTP